MKKTILILLVFFTLTSVFAQQNLNNYKYVIVPNKFEFLNEADEYRINSLTKFLFEKNNFEVLIKDEAYPSDYAKNNCLALNADVIKESSFLKTKLTVQLKNCKNEIVYTSTQGESREKKHKVAYNEALRNAFKSFKTLNYKYNPENVITTNQESEVVEEKQVEIEKLKKEIKELKTEKVETVKQPKVKEQIIKEATPVLSPTPKPEITTNLNVLYAQKTPNGYQLVDKSPKVVFKIKKTGLLNVFLVEGKNAILYQLDANWVLEYYENQKLETKIINIKF